MAGAPGERGDQCNEADDHPPRPRGLFRTNHAISIAQLIAFIQFSGARRPLTPHKRAGPGNQRGSQGSPLAFLRSRQPGKAISPHKAAPMRPPQM
jgi:hypothetical protein